ncbi:MAG: aspartate aminotransferase family protein [Alphaproteobacteria bacterium]|nr:aspartate aminotransferase family protein [Alphaproteobacteria bacterium]
MITPVMPTYGRWNVAVERGEGCYLYATDGHKYLDFTSGIAVTSLGHCHPHLIDAVTEQAKKLWHSSNLFRIPGQERLAQRLVENSFADTVFFNNSGAEAVELSIKVARKYQSETGHPERYRVIACNGSFHGRSFATLAAAGAEAYLKGFGPVMDGFDHVAWDNLNEMRAAVNDKTAALLVEPVQGEGGVRAPSQDFLKGMRAICDEFGLLLIYDEVQCGLGRTGKLFAHEWAGVTPDIMAVAKALGNGFPIGACLATEKAAVGMVPGTHGSTFGGNPMAVAAGNAVLDVMLEPGFLERAERMSQMFRGRLEDLVGKHRNLFDHVRGAGLLIGVKCVITPGDFVTKLRENGLLCLTAGDNVLRILPPLIVTEAEIDQAMGVFEKVAREWPKS